MKVENINNPQKPHCIKGAVCGCKICPSCEGKMTAYDVPIEKVITIPFTQWEIVLRNWNGKDWYCADCSRDSHNQRFDECFNAGMGEGYEKGYDDARREAGKFY